MIKIYSYVNKFLFKIGLSFFLLVLLGGFFVLMIFVGIVIYFINFYYIYVCGWICLFSYISIVSWRSGWVVDCWIKDSVKM